MNWCAPATNSENISVLWATIPSYPVVPCPWVRLTHSSGSDPSNPYHTYMSRPTVPRWSPLAYILILAFLTRNFLDAGLPLGAGRGSLFLALTASSPFLEGTATGHHSSRWQVFPKTPRSGAVVLRATPTISTGWKNSLPLVPCQNVRHLWSAVRPNGDRRPYNLNRLELRICDLNQRPCGPASGNRPASKLVCCK